MLQCRILICIDPAGRSFRTVVPFRFAYTLDCVRQHACVLRNPPRQCFSGLRTIAQLSNMDEFS